MQLLFRMYDVDKTGTLDMEEVTVLIKSVKTSSPSNLAVHFFLVIVVPLLILCWMFDDIRIHVLYFFRTLPLPTVPSL